MSSIIYNGHEIQDLIVNGNQAQLWLNGQKLYPTEEPVDPYNPLGLPPYTIRCKFSSGYTPTMGDSQTLVDAGENVWDITKNSTDWHDLLYNYRSYVREVLGANTTGVTIMGVKYDNGLFKYCTNLRSIPLFDTSSCINMSSMFYGCSNLTSVPLFDTSNVTEMRSMFEDCTSLAAVPVFNTSSCTELGYMFRRCSSLTSVPLLDTTKVRGVDLMFQECVNVESGSLSLYQQMSSQANPPVYHDGTFLSCGSNTTAGAAELAQIPTSWGGTSTGFIVEEE